MSIPIPSPAQIRAALAILEWDMKVLAKAADVSLGTVMNAKDDKNQITPNTRDKIRKAFEGHGIEFTEKDGVRRAAQDVEFFEGQERFEDFYEAVYQHLKNYGGEVCVIVPDEKLFPQFRKDPDLHRKRMQDLTKTKKITRFRVLATHASTKSSGQHRFLPEIGDEPTALYAFGNWMASVSFAHDPAPYVELLKSPHTTRLFMRIFDMLWVRARKEPLEGIDNG